MGTRRLTRAQFQRGEWHQCLVTQCGGTEGFHATIDTASDQRMILGYTRRVETEGTGLQLAVFHFLAKEFKNEFILVELVGAHIDDEMEQVGDYVVLSAALMTVTVNFVAPKSGLTLRKL